MLQMSYNIGYLGFSIFDIFIITYLGNEIQFYSNRLSYCLFESNWTEQSASDKKLLIIMGERLKQPHEIMVGKLYPLTLTTFTKVKQIF